MTLRCTQALCDGEAVRALVNSSGYLHLECAGHVNSWRTGAADRLARLGEDAIAFVRREGWRPLEDSDTVEISVELALTLYVMGT